MLGRILTGRRIEGAHELRIVEEFLAHTGVLAADWAVHHGGARSLGDSARGADRRCAVDDRPGGTGALYIARGLADEVLDLERVTDVHHVDVPDLFGGRRDVHADRLVARGDQ